MTEEKIEDLNEKPPKTYEIGYWLAPFVAEDAKEATVAKEIVAPIEAIGGTVTGQITPALRKLAYPIRKMIDNKYTNFREGYFGSIRFKAVPQSADTLNQTLAKSDLIVRFLLIEIPKVAKIKPQAVVADSGATGPVAKVPTPTAHPEADKVPADEAAIDREIDDLLVEATS